MLKRRLLAAVAACITSALSRDVSAQPGQPASRQEEVQATPIYKLRADFAVPEGPAFKLVAIDPSAIVRPSSVRELSFSVSDFTQEDGSFSLPTQLGFEAAPFLLVQGRDLTRSQYERRAWLYRTRVSIATKLSEASLSPTALGVGIRASLIDDADVRLDDVLAQRVVANLREQHEIYVRAATSVNPLDHPPSNP